MDEQTGIAVDHRAKKTLEDSPGRGMTAYEQTIPPLTSRLASGSTDKRLRFPPTKIDKIEYWFGRI